MKTPDADTPDKGKLFLLFTSTVFHFLGRFQFFEKFTLLFFASMEMNVKFSYMSNANGLPHSADGHSARQVLARFGPIIKNISKKTPPYSVPTGESLQL